MAHFTPRSRHWAGSGDPLRLLVMLSDFLGLPQAKVHRLRAVAVTALGALHGLDDRPDPEALTRLTDAYRPYRMWVTFLLRVAANRGAIPGLAGAKPRSGAPHWP